MSWQNSTSNFTDAAYLNGFILPKLLQQHSSSDTNRTGGYSVKKIQTGASVESIYNLGNDKELVYSFTDLDGTGTLSSGDSVEITLKDLKKSGKDQFLEYYSTGEKVGDCFIQKRIWNDPANEGFVEEDICNG